MFVFNLHILSILLFIAFMIKSYNIFCLSETFVLKRDFCNFEYLFTGYNLKWIGAEKDVTKRGRAKGGMLLDYSNELSDYIKYEQEVRAGEEATIHIKVMSQDNVTVQFKIKKHSPLRKLMLAYCTRMLTVATARFRFDGVPMNEADTPRSLEMEERDTVEVYRQQPGGFSNYKIKELY